MKKCAGLLVLFLFSFKAFAVDPRLDWKTLETDHFLIHFAQNNLHIAAQAAEIAERTHQKLSVEFSWQPKEKTALVISDETDLPNGYALPFPFNRSVLFVTPPDETNTLEDVHNWLETLITHEYVHVLHLDKADGIAANFRKIFGRHLFLFPNMYQPAWLTEGIATWYETDYQQGIGRGQSALFDMMIRADVAAGIKPVSQVNLPIRSWPMGTTSYLYGVYFYRFLEQRYGEQLIKQLVTNYSNNLIPFMINNNARQVVGKDISELWLEYEDWLNKKFQPQIARLEQQGIVEGKALTRDGYYTRQVKILENGFAFYIRDGAFSRPAIMMIDPSGKHHKMASVHSGARFDVHASAGIVITQPEICEQYNIYYDIYLLKPNTKNSERLTHCGRYRSASWSPDGKQIIAVHIDQGTHELHLLNNTGEKTAVLWRGEQGAIIGSPDWSPDGKSIIASVFRNNSGWNIERFNLASKRWQMITNDWNVDVDPQYLSNGQSIVFSSEQKGQYNIFRYDFKDNSRHQLTRVATGAFKPSQLTKQGVLFYAGYGANGYDIYKLDIPATLKKTTLENYKNIENKATAKSQSVQYNIKDYSPWSGLLPRWWTPVLAASTDQSEIGFSTSANDALGVHNYFLTAAMDTINEWPVGRVDYAYSNRLFIGFERTTGILLDLNGDFAIARKQDDAFIALAFPYNSIDSSWNYFLGAFASRDTDGRRATGIGPVPDTRDNILGAAMTYGNAKYFIRSVSLNDGRRVRLVAESSDVWESDFSGEVYTLDWREFIPLGGQHVLALRVAEGYGTDNPDDFRLGGEDNDVNLLSFVQPVSEPLFGQREYALRGYPEGLSQLRGRRMQLGSAEWRFPLGLIERGIMAPPVGIMQLSGSVFIDRGATWNDGSSPDQYYTGTGIELHADMNLFYGINLKVRLGYAKGQDEVLGDERTYFSLGASF